MNNAHGTHWTAFPDPAIPPCPARLAEEGVPASHRLDLGEMLVRNVPTDTRSRDGAANPDGNSIFVFEAGDVHRHQGHLHHEPTPETMRSWGGSTWSWCRWTGAHARPRHPGAHARKAAGAPGDPDALVRRADASGPSCARLEEEAGYAVVRRAESEWCSRWHAARRALTVVVLEPRLLSDD
jgi:hypothetical protein